MLRDGHLKYIRPPNEDLKEIYDLSADPDEIDSQAAKPEQTAMLWPRRRHVAVPRNVSGIGSL